MGTRTTIIAAFLFSFALLATACSPNPSTTAPIVNEALPSATSTKPLATNLPFATKTVPNDTGQPPTASPSAAPSKPAATASKTKMSPTPTPEVTATKKPKPTATKTPTLGPDSWKELPVVPKVPEAIRKIYQRGLELGNDPRAFSKIGDCGSTPAWFLGDFDRGPRFYRLGKYQYLQNVIDYYTGSFDRTSLAARSGFNASALFTPLWADQNYCEPDETPLDCEYRNHKPSIAFVTLGANDVWHPEEFEPQMRKIIDYLLDNGVIPILATKPDNQEGDGLINYTIARLAMEYQIPLWNFWAVTYPLPDHGLQEDKVHLSFGPNYFDNPNAMKTAWTLRNLTALQILNVVWMEINPNQPQ